MSSPHPLRSSSPNPSLRIRLPHPNHLPPVLPTSTAPYRHQAVRASNPPCTRTPASDNSYNAADLPTPPRPFPPRLHRSPANSSSSPNTATGETSPQIIIAIADRGGRTRSLEDRWLPIVRRRRGRRWGKEMWTGGRLLLEVKSWARKQGREGMARAGVRDSRRRRTL